MFLRHAIRASAVLLAVLTLAACAPAAAPDPESAIEQIEALPGVIEVKHSDSFPTVVMAVNASDDEVLEAAASIARIATQTAWGVEVTLSRQVVDPTDEELDITRRAPWSVTVYPGDADAIVSELAGILALEKIDGVLNTGVVDGWPYATLESIDTFAATFRALSATPLFEHGGTMSLYGEDHLQIVWIPERTTLDAVDAIVGIAADYPQAEVLLQASTAGPQWPTLYIARLSTEEAAAIEQRLLDPDLADADPEGYPLDFILTTIGPSGPVYTEGALGGVVE